jgi:hypothetical protein
MIGLRHIGLLFGSLTIFTVAVGTSNQTWQIGGPNGPLFNDNAGALEANNASNTGQVVLRAATPVGSTDVANKSYVDTHLGGITFPTPSTGYAYYNGSAWSYSTPIGSTPTGTGFVHVTGGLQDGASAAVNLAGGSTYITGALPLANLTQGTAAQVLLTNAGATAPAWVTESGDCATTAAGVITCAGLDGLTLPALPGSAKCLENTGSAWAYVSCGGSGSSTTGTGFWHNTSGSLDSASRAVNLNSADVTSTLPVANGGTGAATITAHGVVVGEGTSAVAATAAGTSGVPLLGSGASADPAFGALSLAGGSGVVTGQLPVANIANGTAAQMLVTNSGATAPAWVTMSSDCAITAAGAVTCAGLDGHTLPSLTTGCLNWTGSAWSISACSGTIFTAGTDLAGTSTNQEVVGITGVGGAAIPITPNILRWVQGATAPQITQSQQSNSAAPVNLTLAPQAPGASASNATNGSPGNLIVALASPVNSGSEPGLEITRGGTAILVASGRPSYATVSSQIWVGPNAASASGSNYALEVQANLTILNTSSSGSVYMAVGASQVASFAASGIGLGLNGGNVGIGAGPGYGGCTGCLSLAAPGTLPTSQPGSNAASIYGSGGSLAVNAAGILFPAYIPSPSITQTVATSGSGAIMLIQGQGGASGGNGGLVVIEGGASGSGGSYGAAQMEDGSGSAYVSTNPGGYVYIGGSQTIGIQAPGLQFSGTVTPTINQIAAATSTSGATMTIQAQNATGPGTFNGGTLSLLGGVGVNAGASGGVLLETGDGTTAVTIGAISGTVELVANASYGNFGLLTNGSISVGGGVGAVYIQNAITAPTTDPSGGSILWMSSGGLYSRTANHTQVQVTPAAPVTVNTQASKFLKYEGTINNQALSSANFSTGISVPVDSAKSAHIVVNASCRAIVAVAGGSIGDSWTTTVAFGVKTPSGTVVNVGSAQVVDVESNTSLNSLALVITPSGANAVIYLASTLTSGTVDCQFLADVMEN